MTVKVLSWLYQGSLFSSIFMEVHWVTTKAPGNKQIHTQEILNI